MKILAIEHELPCAMPEKFQQCANEEAYKVWKLYQSDFIRELYFRADRDEAILVLECANVDEARSVLETLPLVREKLIGFELIPLKAYPGFARLFDPRH